MKRANATNLFRKSGVAQWRDLRLTSMKKRNRRLFPYGTFACAGSETADPSCHQGPVGPTAKRYPARQGWVSIATYPSLPVLTQAVRIR